MGIFTEDINYDESNHQVTADIMAEKLKEASSLLEEYSRSYKKGQPMRICLKGFCHNLFEKLEETIESLEAH